MRSCILIYYIVVLNNNEPVDVGHVCNCAMKDDWGDVVCIYTYSERAAREGWKTVGGILFVLKRNIISVLQIASGH